MYEVKGKIVDFGVPVLLDTAIGNISTQEMIGISCVVDTGCAYCHLKQHIIDALKLPELSSVEPVHPIDGLVSLKTYLCCLKLGEVFFREFVVTVLHRQKFPFDFILGSEFLKQYRFTYDGINREVIIYI